MKKGEKRKQDLIQIAYRLFVSRGYEHTSVDEIIAEAGIAKGTYYYYFESKEQMLEDVIGMMLQAEAEKAEAVLSRPFIRRRRNRRSKPRCTGPKTCSCTIKPGSACLISSFRSCPVPPKKVWNKACLSVIISRNGSGKS